jgi:hypothetical protein
MKSVFATMPQLEWAGLYDHVEKSSAMHIFMPASALAPAAGPTMPFIY